MIYTKKRFALCITLVVCNALFIWVNSMLPRAVSSAFSKLVGQFLDWLLPTEGALAEGEGNGYLRKVAHFLEFCSLGLLLSWLFRMKQLQKWKGMLIPFFVGVAVACMDELIQLMNPGRGPALRDVAIDASGVAIGIIVISLIAGYRASHANKNELS